MAPFPAIYCHLKLYNNRVSIRNMPQRRFFFILASSKQTAVNIDYNNNFGFSSGSRFENFWPHRLCNTVLNYWRTSLAFQADEFLMLLRCSPSPLHWWQSVYNSRYYLVIVTFCCSVISEIYSWLWSVNVPVQFLTSDNIIFWGFSFYVYQ